MTEATSKPISRRTVAKGAAWTAPVILGATSIPAYAASGNIPTISFGAACKAPGASCKPFVKGYVFTATITNTSNKTVYLYVPPTITSTGVLDLVYQGYKVGNTLNTGHIPVPANSSVVVQMNTSSNNSSNLVFSFTISFTWGHTPDPADDTEHAGTFVSSTVNVPGTPPDCCKDDAAAASSSTTAARSSEPSSSSSSTSAAAPKSTSGPAQAPAVEPASTSTSAPVMGRVPAPESTTN